MSPPKLDIGAELLVVLTHEIEAGMYDDTIAELRAARTLKERREILRIAFTLARRVRGRRDGGAHHPRGAHQGDRVVSEAKRYTVDGGAHAGVVVVFKGAQPDEGSVLGMWGEPLAVAEIGRASCRERVSSPV